MLIRTEYEWKTSRIIYEFNLQKTRKWIAKKPAVVPWLLTTIRGQHPFHITVYVNSFATIGFKALVKAALFANFLKKRIPSVNGCTNTGFQK